jgi:hypothetical protein
MPDAQANDTREQPRVGGARFLGGSWIGGSIGNPPLRMEAITTPIAAGQSGRHLIVWPVRPEGVRGRICHRRLGYVERITIPGSLQLDGATPRTLPFRIEGEIAKGSKRVEQRHMKATVAYCRSACKPQGGDCLLPGEAAVSKCNNTRRAFEAPHAPRCHIRPIGLVTRRAILDWAEE